MAIHAIVFDSIPFCHSDFELGHKVQMVLDSK